MSLIIHGTTSHEILMKTHSGNTMKFFHSISLNANGQLLDGITYRTEPCVR